MSIQLSNENVKPYYNKNHNNNSDNNCFIGGDDNGGDSNPARAHAADNNDIAENDAHGITVNIFRFKFTDDFGIELYKFSKIHQYDHRKDFKSAWETWIKENNELVREETERLGSLGYYGDVEDKMFKSARYYFRKKSTEKKEPQERKNYIGVKKELLEKMDEHINEKINTVDYSPAEGFLDFCKINGKLLQEEVNRLYTSGIKDSTEIKNKIKKTYKNRYFMFISK